MKLQLLLVISLFIIQTYCQSCKCGHGHLFNKVTWKCDSYPKKDTETGYVKNCALYTSDGNANSTQCVQCKEEYYFNAQDNVCEETNLKGCLQITKVANTNTTNTTNTTATNNTQQQNQPERIYRFLDDNNDNNGQYECTKCDDREYYLANKQCTKYPSGGDNHVKDCQKYEINAQGELVCSLCDKHYFYEITNSKCTESRNQNAPCVKCEDDYFVGKSYQCVKAKDVVDKCISATYDFNNSNYNCQSCEEGYYAKDGACVENPKEKSEGKVEDCSKYEFQTNLSCVKCEENRYMKNSTSCVEVTNKIEHCDIYKNMDYCQACDFGYAAFGGDEIAECKKCPKGADDSGNVLGFSLLVALSLLSLLAL